MIEFKFDFPLLRTPLKVYKQFELLARTLFLYSKLLSPPLISRVKTKDSSQRSSKLKLGGLSGVVFQLFQVERVEIGAIKSGYFW